MSEAYEYEPDEWYYRMDGIGLQLYTRSSMGPWAELRAFTYPDGSFRNHLSSGELRDVATMLNDAADKLEEAKNE